MQNEERNQNQFTKLLMFAFENLEDTWTQDGNDWWRWAIPVYRNPQASWALANGFTHQKIWYAEKTGSGDPNGTEFPEWFQCYWDTQASRWSVIESNMPDGRIFMTPTGGIAARSGTTAGTANCVQWKIASDGTMTEVSGSSVAVKNIFGSDIAGDAYITAKRVNGVWIIDSEDCGNGS